MFGQTKHIERRIGTVTHTPTGGKLRRGERLMYDRLPDGQLKAVVVRAPKGFPWFKIVFLAVLAVGLKAGLILTLGPDVVATRAAELAQGNQAEQALAYALQPEVVTEHVINWVQIATPYVIEFFTAP